MFERMILFSFVLLSVLELSYGNDQFNENRDWSTCGAFIYSTCFLGLSFIDNCV